MVTSAARGSWTNINQMTGMKGPVRNPAGRIIDFPILSSYKEGLNVLEYFISTHGARKGTADTALKTAKAGYLTRRLVDVAQDVVISEDNCKDKEGFLINRKSLGLYDEKLENKVKGRVLAKNLELSVKKPGASRKSKLKLKAGHLITVQDAQMIEESGVDNVYIRSALTCQSKWGICKMCYGYDLGFNELVKSGEAVGIIAAQAIGEPGTQLTMRTFHTGGVAVKGGDITLGLPRVEELFEARVPANLAVITEVAGVVLEIKGDEKDKSVIILPDEPAKIDSKKSSKKTKKTELIEYKIPFGKRIIVEKDQKVKAGTPLSDGPLDIKHLFKIAGKEVVENYILREVGKVYNIQGVSINDKHLEVIVRQMFSRFKISDPGDTNLSVGKTVERTILLEENEKIKNKDKQAKAKQLIRPVSKVALTTDSFLSAASFQDTARVLIQASVEGSRDKLRGLKENVIIGRLIPAGTGYRKDVEAEEDEKDTEEEE
jgi:DNA-directed RNA polymerase subunit beta'